MRSPLFLLTLFVSILILISTLEGRTMTNPSPVFFLSPSGTAISGPTSIVIGADTDIGAPISASLTIKQKGIPHGISIPGTISPPIPGYDFLIITFTLPGSSYPFESSLLLTACVTYDNEAMFCPDNQLPVTNFTVTP